MAEDNEDPLDQVADGDYISSLSKLSDADLAQKLGFVDKVAKFRADLVEASKLPDKGKAKVNDQLSRMFTPDTYRIDDLRWTIERAKDKASGKTTPSSLVADCGCGPMDD